MGYNACVRWVAYYTVDAYQSMITFICAIDNHAYWPCCVAEYFHCTITTEHCWFDTLNAVDFYPASLFSFPLIFIFAYVFHSHLMPHFSLSWHFSVPFELFPNSLNLLFDHFNTWIFDRMKFKICWLSDQKSRRSGWKKRCPIWINKNRKKFNSTVFGSWSYRSTILKDLALCRTFYLISHLLLRY